MNEEVKQAAIFKKEHKQKPAKVNEDREYIERFEKFKKDSKQEEITSVLPSQLGMSKKTKSSGKKNIVEKDLIDFSEETDRSTKLSNKTKEKQDLLEFNKENLEVIKHLKEKVLKPKKINEVKDKDVISTKITKNMQGLG